MSQLLVSELTALSSEAKRKSPDVRTASDNALAALRSNSGDGVLAAKSERAIAVKDNVLLQPIVLACSGKTATPKVVGIAVGLLQRVIGLKIVRDDDCPELVGILEHVVGTRNDVEVQLKVLQAVSSLLSNYTSVHYDVLARTLGVCFQLQDSRVGVVSSTAAATLRQAVMTVYDKVKEEDRVLSGIKLGGEDAAAAAPLATMTVQLPSAVGSVTLFPCSRDAYLILSDLNALANNEQARFLRLHSLPRTFTLELIESILTNHAHLFRDESHPELLLNLRQATCPLLIKAFNDTPSFPTTLRLVRLLFVLLRQFSSELVVEVEILMSILLKFIAPSDLSRRISTSSTATNDSRKPHDNLPAWQRVLAMEATRNLCSDGVLMRNLWTWFDAKSDSSRVFTQLVDTLHKLATENPGLIGPADAAQQMTQTTSASQRRPSQPDRRRSQSGLYNTAAGVASAAIGGLASVAEQATSSGSLHSSNSSSAGLSQTSIPSVQLIDQLDKADAPNVPPTYVYLLALQALVNLAQSLAAYALPVYSRMVNSRPRTAPRAPPALDFDALPAQDRVEMMAVRDMVLHSWAPLLDSFTFFLSSRCDDVLFAEVLIALRNFTNTTGALGLESPRDALIASLARFAIPRSVIASLMATRNRPSASTSEETDVTLSERNAACLKAVTQIAYYLSGSIGSHWRDVLETLCDAEYVLRRSHSRRRSHDDDAASSATPLSPSDAYKPRQGMASISALSTIPPGFSSSASLDAASGRPMALSQIDNATLIADVARVFENTASLGDASLLSFIEALCELDGDHVGLTATLASNGTAVAPMSALNRSSPLSSLATVAMLNVERLTRSSDLERAWVLITSHLLTLASQSTIRPSLRMQAATSLDNLAQAALRLPTMQDEEKASVQRKAVDVLARQSILDGKRRWPADLEVRKAGLETFMAVLESHGHALLLGWETIFSVFDAACAPSVSEEDRSVVPLIKVAFGAMQAVCSNLLAKLSLDELKLCVNTLTYFSSQEEEVNVALTASGALWGITAEVSSRMEAAQKDASPGDDPLLTEMWVHILTSVKRLTEDERLQVRNGAISVLFNILEQYGMALPEAVWQTSIMKDILLPLLESLAGRTQQASAVEEIAKTPRKSEGASADLRSSVKQWDESRVLALASTGKIVRQMLLAKLLDADDVWTRLLERLTEAFLQGPVAVSQASVRALHHILQASVPKEQQEAVLPIWRAAWQAWCAMGGGQLSAAKTVFSQANLLAYVETLTPLYAVLGQDLALEEVERMMASLKVVMAYDKGAGAERISDKDRLSALQQATMSRITTLHITVMPIAARVLSDLAEYSTLAFIDATSAKAQSNGRATYLALSRAATDAMVATYDQWAGEAELYRAGAVQQAFAALAIPLRLRYDCPRVKGGRQDDGEEDEGGALWKNSMLALCKVSSVCCERLDELSSLSSETLDTVWTSMVAAITAALTADCSPILQLPVDRQDVEETFDLVLLVTIETKIWPHLGKESVPNACIVALAKALASTSQSTAQERQRPRSQGDADDEDPKREADKVSKEAGFAAEMRVPRELFAYWCFDLLLLLCEAVPSVSPVDQRRYRRVAAYCLPSLVERVQAALSAYINASVVRGAAPLSRIHDEEVNYILTKLNELTLWPGCLAVAFATDGEETETNMRLYLDDALAAHADARSATRHQARTSDRALLFHLYPVLCDFLLYVVPRHTATGLRKRATCGSSRALPHSVTLPNGLILGQIGRVTPVDESASGKEEASGKSSFISPPPPPPPLTADSRELTRALLDKVGQAWLH